MERGIKQPTEIIFIHHYTILCILSTLQEISKTSTSIKLQLDNSYSQIVYSGFGFDDRSITTLERNRISHTCTRTRPRTGCMYSEVKILAIFFIGFLNCQILSIRPLRLSFHSHCFLCYD